MDTEIIWKGFYKYICVVCQYFRNQSCGSSLIKVIVVVRERERKQEEKRANCMKKRSIETKAVFFNIDNTNWLFMSEKGILAQSVFRGELRYNPRYSYY